MERLMTIFLIAILAVIGIRLLLIPMKLARKLLIHTACGLVCLWLLNLCAGITGLAIPINAITAFIAGVLGVPGILLLALIQLR